VTLRPTFANLVMILSSASVGLGSASLAPDWFATSPSLLPNGTLHVGPPLCRPLSVVYDKFKQIENNEFNHLN
jgi:hypothetical protein